MTEELTGTVRIEAQLLKDLLDYINTESEMWTTLGRRPHRGVMSHHLYEAYTEVLNIGVTSEDVGIDPAKRIETFANRVNITLDTNREVTTHATLESVSMDSGPPMWDGENLQLEIVEDDLDRVLADSVARRKAPVDREDVEELVFQHPEIVKDTYPALGSDLIPYVETYQDLNETLTMLTTEQNDVLQDVYTIDDAEAEIIRLRSEIVDTVIEMINDEYA